MRKLNHIAINSLPMSMVHVFGLPHKGWVYDDAAAYIT